MRLHLNCACIALIDALIMRINPQNNSSNSRGDGAQEGTGHGGLNVGLEWAP